MNSAWSDRIRLALGPIIVALPLFFPGHIAAVEIEEEIVEQKYAVDPDATLSIHHTDGSIRIYAGDDAEVSIRAIKKAYSSERLKNIVLDVKATPKSIVIETLFPPKGSPFSLSDRSGTVEFIITVPPTLRITRLDLVNGEVLVDGLFGGCAKAHLVNGWLGARNCFGDLNLTLENGRLEIEYDYWENAKFSARLSNANGGILAIMPSDASASITAHVAGGAITNALATEDMAKNEPSDALNFAIGPEPEAVVEMNATSGNITIAKTY
jgi:DUF4097 and DUF4098 domain-containing protein YvlB